MLLHSAPGADARAAGSAIQLVCIDVDGTLIGSAGDVHPLVWTAASRARAAGVRLAVCSGRPAFGVARDYAERLGPAGWHSFQNGASVVHLGSRESRSARMPEDAVAMLIERAHRTGRLLELYSDADYVVIGDHELAQGHASLLGVEFHPRPVATLRGAIVRAQWLVPFSETPTVLAEPNAGLVVSPSTSPLMPETQFISLTPPGIDKASAVRVIAGAYDIPLERVMFVGDGPNDASAMRIVGHAIAMGNAEPEAIDASRHTVAHVDDAGLAEAIDLAVAA